MCLSGCSLDTVPGSTRGSTRVDAVGTTPGHSKPDDREPASEMAGPEEDAQARTEPAPDAGKRGRRGEREAGSRAGSGAVGSKSAATAGRGAAGAGEVAGARADAAAGAGGVGGTASMPEPPEGPCDLPACVPQEVRQCIGVGACQIGERDARVCFENGVRVTHEDGPYGAVTTAVRADGSTCFSATVAIGASGEVGAIYRDSAGERFAVAGLRGTRWSFQCPDGTAKLVELQTCRMLNDVPPGFGELGRCAPGPCN